MDRTLYLNEAKGIEIVRDGPSLLVKESGKANRRIPVRLIGRVFISGNVKLESGVFSLLAENQIPVMLMSVSGDNGSVCLPYNDRLPLYYDKQRIFIETEDNVSRFKAFCVSWRKRFQIEALTIMAKTQAQSFLEEGIKESEYCQAMAGYFTAYERQIKTVRRIVSNLSRGLIVEMLVKARLDPHMGVVHRRQNFGFALDISYILSPETDLQCVIFLQSCKGNNIDINSIHGGCGLRDVMRDIAGRYEGRRKRLGEKIELIIDDLFSLMRELGA
ncbi:MAG: CRISPR-associated endonuclease Cas1 [Candidatus Magnetobacterium sp. LHC-1]|uniref:CRISPR-associated endonuclease Cas1 n=1 Tax=Candidatus Magnetobacterium casense TaxID=1455061 RepID=A0ABS6S090_9BACT|nr:CRISPR-associated endonuclease Cas1 [Candidatus Magnetobacterium casensis]MBF0608515.1 CRISPR-associated endonuclease Cas1 [Nitrospirota bacterium]MBV6341995.1 CRISPR-associated endonuclease Cas1 [Candidatus Magnetobacterium casensis]